VEKQKWRNTGIRG